MSESPKSRRLSADRITAVLLLGLGAAVTWGGWAMDRLENRHIHPASIPGLLPIMLGIALMVCAAILYGQSRSAADAASGPDLDFGAWKRWLLILLLTLGYALGMVGNLPFWLATAVFVSVFICVFEWPRDGDPRRIRRLLAIALVEGAVVAVGVAMLFEKAFLVRLP